MNAFSASTFAEKPLTVLASIPPLGLLAKSIVGDQAHVDVLLDQQASAHHYALSIADRQQLASADMVLWVGEDLEGFLAKPVQQRLAKGGAVVTAMHIPSIDWPDSDGSGGGHDHHHDHDHDHGEHDPHIWLNPLNNIMIIDAFVEKLVRIDPRNANLYRDNAEKHKAQLQALDKSIMTVLSPLQNVPFIVAHPAYTHFVHRYHLQQLHFITVTPERSSGAKHLIALRKLKQVECVFNDYGVRNAKAEQLARDLNVSIGTLDPLGIREEVNAYIDPRLAVHGASGIAYVIAQLANDFQACLSGVTP
jgi:zinc transport system substrate-binding protein